MASLDPIPSPPTGRSIQDHADYLRQRLEQNHHEWQIAKELGVPVHRVIFALTQLGLKSYG